MISINTQQLEKRLNDIVERLEKIENLINKYESSLNGYISEADAKKKLKKGTTWFWNQRKNGLPFFKIGGQVYYKETELFVFLIQSESV